MASSAETVNIENFALRPLFTRRAKIATRRLQAQAQHRLNPHGSILPTSVTQHHHPDSTPGYDQIYPGSPHCRLGFTPPAGTHPYAPPHEPHDVMPYSHPYSHSHTHHHGPAHSQHHGHHTAAGVTNILHTWSGTGLLQGHAMDSDRMHRSTGPVFERI